MDLIAAEVDGTDPGAPAVMASLVDLLFVYLLRTWFGEHHDDADWGRANADARGHSRILTQPDDLAGNRSQRWRNDKS